MSHFCGLVILTPDYAATHDYEDSLEKYYEGLETPEYCTGEVSDKCKLDFIEYYMKSDIGGMGVLKKKFFDYASMTLKKKMVKAFKNDPCMDGTPTIYSTTDDWERFYAWCYHHFADEAVKWFKKVYKKWWDGFDTLYQEHGEGWNGNSWRKNEEGVWCGYSTYNPDSKWDWYELGGRWANSIKTKSGEFVDECLLGEIDLTPFTDDDYEEGKDWSGKPCKQLKESVKYHYTENSLPFCIIINGKWYEKGKMGWWAMVSDEKDTDDWHGEVLDLLKSLPEDSEVHNIDFHI
jgi:hypothetical protein